MVCDDKRGQIRWPGVLVLMRKGKRSGVLRRRVRRRVLCGRSAQDGTGLRLTLWVVRQGQIGDIVSLALAVTLTSTLTITLLLWLLMGTARERKSKVVIFLLVTFLVLLAVHVPSPLLLLLGPPPMLAKRVSRSCLLSRKGGLSLSLSLSMSLLLLLLLRRLAV